jgi:RHS repeat-associated protein
VSVGTSLPLLLRRPERERAHTPRRPTSRYGRLAPHRSPRRKCNLQSLKESFEAATGPYGALAFTYDGVGNRVTYKVGTATDTYTYPLTSNRLGSISLAAGGTRAFTYDAAGNVIADNRGAGFGYTYDSAGRLSELRINGVLQAQYRYDFAGRQAVRTLTSTVQTIHSVFDSSGNRIAEYDQTSGALLREYVWNGLTPVAVIENGAVYFIRVDHIGRPVFATNAAGAKVWTATYTPFGEVHASTGTPIALRFPGQWFQSESGLHQNWMRDYDPTTGRYLEADPLGLVGGASVYGYARGNPGRYVDPRGGQSIPLPGAGPSPFGPAGAVMPGTPLGDALGDSAGSAFGALLDLSHNYNPIDLGMQWATKQWVDDPQAKAEHKEYKDRYDDPPPPGMDECEFLMWKLRREQALLLARQLWDAKWGPGTHAKAILQSQRAVDNAKRALEEAGCGCP